MESSPVESSLLTFKDFEIWTLESLKELIKLKVECGAGGSRFKAGQCSAGH